MIAFCVFPHCLEARCLRLGLRATRLEDDRIWLL